MGYVLKPGLREAIRDFDPAVDIFFNNRIGRWVVACVGVNLVDVHPDLIGIPGMPAGGQTHWSPVFRCEAERNVGDPAGAGAPIVPDVWIVERLKDLRRYKHRTSAEYDAEVKVDKERRQRAFQNALDGMSDNFRENLSRYSELVGRARKSVIITNNPIATG